MNTRWIGLGAGRDLLRGRMPFPAARCFSVACGRPAFVMCPIGVPPFEITCAFAVTWDRTGEAEGISRVSMLAMLSSPSFPFPPIPVLVQSFIPIQPQVQPRKALRMAIAIAECQRRSFGYGAAGGTPGGEVHEVGYVLCGDGHVRCGPLFWSRYWPERDCDWGREVKRNTTIVAAPFPLLILILYSSTWFALRVPLQSSLIFRRMV